MGKVWLAEELEKMSREEQQAIFESCIVTDLSTLPPEYLERVTARFKKVIKEREGIDGNQG